MGMMIQPIIEGEGGGKLTEDILCMKWDDYKKCGKPTKKIDPSKGVRCKT